jgi:hypothetical protein
VVANALSSQGLHGMRDSPTYQYILEEGRIKGRAEGARQMPLRLRRKHLGEPDTATLTQLQAITEVQRLERLGECLLDVANWQELLQTP